MTDTPEPPFSLDEVRREGLIQAPATARTPHDGTGSNTQLSLTSTRT